MVTRKEAHRKVYNTRRWRNLRAWILSRNRVCRCGRLTTMVHHIDPIRDGGDPWELSNLEALCHACHRREHPAGGSESAAWSALVEGLAL